MDTKLMADDVALAYRRAGFKVRTHPYFLTFPDIVLATLNTKAFAQVSTDTDSLFVMLQINHRKQYGLFPVAEAGCGMKITDLQNSYTFGEQDLVPSESIAGSGEAPSILAFPYTLAPGSRLRAEAIHLAGHNPGGTVFPNPDTTSITVTVTIVGVKLVTWPFTRQILMPEV